MSLAFFYNLLSLVISFFFTLFGYPRRNETKRRRWLRERWAIDTPGPHDVWIHAVSVGETLAAASVIAELKKLRPGLRIALSTVTDTGQEVARSRLSGVTIFYLPWDVRFLMGRIFNFMNPAIVAVVETEIWPGLIAEAHSRSIPLIILNGRISDRSYRGYKRIGFFIRPILERVAFFGMQSDADLDRIRQLGAPEKKSGVTGNVKFDLSPPDTTRLPAWLSRLSPPVWVAGSTHDGEESLILEAYRMVREKLGREMTLVIVPRHPERFEPVARLIADQGFSPLLRSRFTSEGEKIKGIVLLDAMGELASAYAAADVVFVGGSLVPRGGHNILEPALWSKPVLFGPHMENFRAIAEVFLSERAGAVVRDAQDLASRVEGWIRNPAEAGELAARGHGIVIRNRGASARSAGMLLGYLDEG